MKPSSKGLISVVIIAAVIGVIVYGGGGYVLLNKQSVVDQVHYSQFIPTSSSKEQVTRSGMSPKGQFLFYASDPVVLEKTDFNQTCSTATSDSSVLGCYITATGHIYLYHQTDKRLDGEEEVMAAHEMLRAVWQRMSAAQRDALVPELTHVLATNEDTRLDLKSRYDNVVRNDPNDRYGELYAMLGTEVPNVGTALEASYAPYFVKRSTVTKLNEFAIAYVVALTTQITSFDDELTATDAHIKVRKKAITAAIKVYNSDVSKFNARAEAFGGFASEGQFNVARNGLESRRNSLNAQIKKINKTIDAYNAQLKQLNGLLKTAVDLGRSLNTTLTPLPAVTNVA